MFQKPEKKWTKVLSQPFEKQSKFLNKICKVNRRDALILNERYFDGLSFPLVGEVVELVQKVIAAGEFDPSFRDLILDRLLRVIGIEELYPEDYEDGNECNGDDDNVIFGENYHVYTACYDDLDILVNFINSTDGISNLCDLGSGTGRALFYLAMKVKKELNYLGLELVDERVKFTNKISKYFSLDNVRFQTCDFLEDPQAFHGYDAYYLYDSVGTENVPHLIGHFKNLIDDGQKFYLFFISGWDEIMLSALNELDGLKLVEGNDSHKQEGRVVNIYQTL
ncbi:methyltransferase domain-containing protein [Halobacteriovorax sp.]|uniref:methyltransferase domain-containing protein n=1 Tax=Halobacteriovorax sp. TaxID=2020862 RepID=UPI003AF274C2